MRYTRGVDINVKAGARGYMLLAPPEGISR